MEKSSTKRHFEPASGGEDQQPSPTKKPATMASTPATPNRMRVYVRVRPKSEKEMNTDGVVDVIDNQMLVFDPLIENQDFYYEKKYKEIGKKVNKNITFYFDRVFGDKSSNMEVYESVTKCFIKSLLDGFNCTVFAYGATGSGKTHTMLGSVDDPGVVFFTAMELFKIIEEKRDERLEVSVSYFEIYNEKVYDLLSPESNDKNKRIKLDVREDPQRGVTVANLSVHHPNDATNLIEMLEYGNANRCQQATDANEFSSRSHAIFQIYLKKQDFSSSQQRCIQTPKMCLVDLAGSERAKVAYKNNRHKNLQAEGGNINKSLLALGECINALASQDHKKQSNKYVPYRSSKLTLLLKDSLGGNCQTAMIATVSPSYLSFDDTSNTLSYANRAKGIQLSVRRKSIAVGIQPRHYTQALECLEQKIRDLENDNHMLRNEMAKLQEQMKSSSKNLVADQKTSIEILNSHKNTLDQLFKDRFDLRKQLMECESNLKKTDLRLLLRKLENERLKALKGCSDEDQLRSLFGQQMHYSDSKRSILKKIEENEKTLNEIEKEIRSRTDDGDVVIDAYFRDEHLKTEHKDVLFAKKHADEIAHEILSRFDNNEEIIIDAMKVINYVQDVLNGMNRLSDELANQFFEIRKKVEGKKNVVWRDNVPDKTRLSFYKQIDFKHIFRLSTYCALPKSPITSPTTSKLVTVCNGLTPIFEQKFKTIPSTVTKSVAAVVPFKSSSNDALNDTFTINERTSAKKQHFNKSRNNWKPYHVPSRSDENTNTWHVSKNKGSYRYRRGGGDRWTSNSQFDSRNDGRYYNKQYPPFGTSSSGFRF